MRCASQDNLYPVSYTHLDVYKRQQLSSVLLINPENVEEGAAVCQLPNGEEVNFYQMIPLYEEEVNFKIQNGAETLLGKMGEISAVVDIHRLNVCEGFGRPKE